MALPLPKVVSDVGPGGPGVTQLRGINALINDIYENKIKSSEAQYAPWNNYANAASKLAYSQFVGPQALASILSDPKIRGLLSNEQYNNLANAVTGQLKNPVNALSGMPTPQNNGNSLLGHLLNKLGLGSEQKSQNAVMQSPIAQVEGQNETVTPEAVKYLADNGQEAFNERYDIPPLKPGESYVYPGPTKTGQSAIQRTGNKILPTGAQGGINPQAITAAEEAALKAQAAGEAKVNNEMWREMNAESAKEAILAQNTLDLANEFSEAYDRLEDFEKGPIKGSLPPLFSEAADTADRAAMAMGDAVARAQQQGHITQADRATYLSMKPNRSMRPQTKDNAIAFIKGMNQRVQEHVIFNVEAQRMGLNPQEANAVWLNYIKNNDFYNKKDRKLNTENFNKWPQYLTPQKIQEALHPKPGKKQSTYSNEDIEFTAKKYGMTIDQVKKKLGIL